MNKVKQGDPTAITRCVEVLRAGGVVLHPTETCYGLAVDVFNEEALRKLYTLKEMSFDKPVSILVSDLAMAERFGEFSTKASKLAADNWPGPLALVVPRKGLPEFLNLSETTVSLRCSDMEFCRQLVEAFGGPISTTSANVTNQPQAYSLEDLEEDFLSQVDLIVDGGQLPMAKPSTILKVDGDEVTILRRGELMPYY